MNDINFVNNNHNAQITIYITALNTRTELSKAIFLNKFSQNTKAATWLVKREEVIRISYYNLMHLIEIVSDFLLQLFYFEGSGEMTMMD